MFSGIERIHPCCRESLNKGVEYVQAKLGPNLLGICVVGSSTCSDWEEGSDIDLLILTKDKVRYQELGKMNNENNELRSQVQVRVQFIFMEPDCLLNYHLQNRTTMAHSISRGVIIFDQKGYLSRFLELSPTHLPVKEWIKDYFLHFFYLHQLSLETMKEEKRIKKKLGKEFSSCFENEICRVIVNYSILYLELQEIIPTTKKQIVRGLQWLELSPDIIQSVERSLYIRRDDCFVKEEEVDGFIDTANLLAEELKSILGIDEIEE